MTTVRQRQRNDRRLLMLTAAAAEFMERGYQDARIEDVAARAGVAASTVYNYFGDKPSLLLAIFTERMESLAAQLTPLSQAPGPDLLAAVDTYMNICLDRSTGLAPSRELLREAYGAAFAGPKGSMGTFISRDDQLVRGCLHHLMIQHRTQYGWPLPADPVLVGDVVFAIGNLHWQDWITDQLQTIDQAQILTLAQCRAAVTALTGCT